jgi:hypothetical protein
VQLGAGRRCASAATAAIGEWDAHDTVGPPASAVVSLSMLTKTVPTPRRARRARARNLRTEQGPQIMGRETPGGRLRMPSIAVPGSRTGLLVIQTQSGLRAIVGESQQLSYGFFSLPFQLNSRQSR